MRAVVCAALLAAAAGCGDKGRGQVPAVGTVTLDGKPVAGAIVTFYPEMNSPGQGGYATTDSAGRFEIEYPGNGKGLVPGEYRVTVNRPPGGGGNTDQAPDDAVIDAPVRAARGIPGRYASPENTPLRAKVEPGGAPIELKLETGKK